MGSGASRGVKYAETVVSLTHGLQSSRFTSGSGAFSLAVTLDARYPDRYAIMKPRFDKFREIEEADHPVFAVAIAEESRMLAAAATDAVHLWDLSAYEIRVSLRAHEAMVWAVEFSPNESTLATASADKTVRLWDTSDGSPLGCLKGHSDALRCLSFSPLGLLITGSADEELLLWEFNNVRPIRRWAAHKGWVSAVTFSKVDPNVALSTGRDGTVAAWRVVDGEEGLLARFPGCDGCGVLCLDPHPADAEIVSIGVEDGSVWIWHFGHKVGDECVHGHTHLRGHAEAVWTVNFSDNGSLLASGSTDCTVRLWNTTDVWHPTLTAVFRAHDSHVRQLRFRPSGTGIVTCGADAKVSIWITPKRLWRLRLKDHPRERQRKTDQQAELPPVPPASSLAGAAKRDGGGTPPVPPWSPSMRSEATSISTPATPMQNPRIFAEPNQYAGTFWSKEPFTPVPPPPLKDDPSSSQPQVAPETLSPSRRGRHSSLSGGSPFTQRMQLTGGTPGPSASATPQAALTDSEWNRHPLGLPTPSGSISGNPTPMGSQPSLRDR